MFWLRNKKNHLVTHSYSGPWLNFVFIALHLHNLNRTTPRKLTEDEAEGWLLVPLNKDLECHPLTVLSIRPYQIFFRFSSPPSPIKYKQNWGGRFHAYEKVEHFWCNFPCQHICIKIDTYYLLYIHFDNLNSRY